MKEFEYCFSIISEALISFISINIYRAPGENVVIDLKHIVRNANLVLWCNFIFLCNFFLFCVALLQLLHFFTTLAWKLTKGKWFCDMARDICSRKRKDLCFRTTAAKESIWVEDSLRTASFHKPLQHVIFSFFKAVIIVKFNGDLGKDFPYSPLQFLWIYVG